MLPLALVLDAVLGEVPWQHLRLPHPVIWIGSLISQLETWLNHGAARKAKGILALILVLAICLILPILIWQIPGGWLLEILGGAFFLAHRSLVDHVQAVADGLRKSLAQGRSAVAMIVGRDPERLDEAGVSRAAIESAAENFSDGVVAPAFWFAVGGLPGIVAYKVVNTADSMIGHRTERYEDFGWPAARLDDLLNWVPARLTGLLFCLVGGGIKAFHVMLRDAPLHRSPSAGWPEAAMAASLGRALAGPRDYGSYQVDDPYMNAEGSPDASARDIDRAIALLWRAWAVLLGLSMLTLTSLL